MEIGIRKYFTADGIRVVNEEDHREALAAKDAEIATRDGSIAKLRDNIGELIGENNYIDHTAQLGRDVYLLRRAVEWCLQLGATKTVSSIVDHYDVPLKLPPELAPYILGEKL